MEHAEQTTNDETVIDWILREGEEARDAELRHLHARIKRLRNWRNGLTTVIVGGIVALVFVL